VVGLHCTEPIGSNILKNKRFSGKSLLSLLKCGKETENHVFSAMEMWGRSGRFGDNEKKHPTHSNCILATILL
jgi:hypothetical protein